MKKFISMLLILVAALVVSLTTTSCAHRSGHHHFGSSRDTVYSTADSAFVLNLASTLFTNECSDVDSYIAYREAKAHETECNKILSSLSPAVLKRLAAISIREYGKVDDLVVAELYLENKNLLKYMDDNGNIDPGHPVATNSELDDSIEQYSRFGGGVD